MKNNQESPFWNPLLENLEPERLNQLRFKKFIRIMKWAYQRSPFYRELYKKAGVEPGDIKTWADISRLPKVNKEMIRETQSSEPFPYGKILAVPLEEVVDFRQTSGTTGQPVYQADTWADWEWWSECWSYILWAQGYRPKDRVFIPFGYNIFVAFWAGHYAAEKIGCEVIPGGVLDTAARLLKIQELKPTAMMATPTYVLNMAEVARTHLKIDPSKLSIAKITCAGEPGALIPSTKNRMETGWGAKVFDHAGATEIGAWSFECSHQSGGLHINDAFFLVEIEDLETEEIITEPGRCGKMVITALDRMAQPCIRFDSNDIIEWSANQCECGRTFRLLQNGVQGRSDDLTKVKGVLLAPSAIEEVVRYFSELADEYEVVVDRVGEVDRIAIKVECIPEAEFRQEEILTALKNRLRLKTNLGFRIDPQPPGTLERYVVKARRFKDLRSKH